MPLLRRITRLFAADVHAVLDQLEEPEAVLRHSIYEMEDALEQDHAEIRLLRRELDTLDKRRRTLETARAELEPQLDLCFEDGREDMARRLIRRQLELGAELDAAVRRRESLGERLEELEATVRTNRDELEGMRQRAELFGVSREVSRETDRERGLCAIDDDDVELALLRAKHARARA